MDVSIHAPARGATYRHERCWCCRSVSIHAPARGATLPLPRRLRAGAVSIHAPARGRPYFSFGLQPLTPLRATYPTNRS